MVRTGEYINIYDENLEYDAYVIFGEVADKIKPEEIDAIEEALTPIIKKTNWSKVKRHEHCENVLDNMIECNDESNLGWGYDVIIIK